MSISFADKQLHWLFFVLPAILLVFAIVIFAVMSSKNAESGVYDGVYEKLIETRLLYSPECIVYVDEANQRTYTGVIDLKKLSEPTINSCLPLDKQYQPAFMMELRYTGEETKIRTFISDNWDSKTKARKITTNEYPVQVYGRGPGKLTFTYRY